MTVSIQYSQPFPAACRVFTSPIFWLLLMSVAAPGCGTGTYDARMKKRMDELQASAQFNRMLEDAYYPVTDETAKPVGVAVRRPKLFEKATAWRRGFDADPPVVIDGKKVPVDEERIQPPFYYLPGFSHSYELFLNDTESVPRPVYLYFATADKKNTSVSQWESQIADGLKKAFPSEAAAWETVELPTPEGATISYRRISVTGAQRFDSRAKEHGLADLSGRLDLYLYSAENYLVIVGWRAPVEFVVPHSIAEAVTLSLGTLREVPVESAEKS